MNYDENTREGRHLTPEERIALQAEEIKQLQQENNGWQERYYELDAGHSRLFKDFCKLQKENEQLQAQVARMREVMEQAREALNWIYKEDLALEDIYETPLIVEKALAAIDKAIGGGDVDKG